MTSDQETIFNSILKVLNEAAALDPKAINNLLSTRVDCNRALADHPTIQVLEIETYPVQFEVGTLGLINGIVEPLTGERIMAKWNDDGKLIEFVRYIRS